MSANNTIKRVVVKVGSAVLTENSKIALARLQSLVIFLVELKKHYEVILVSSGAVSAGYTKLKLDRSILKNKQALAAIGQPILMKHYAREFYVHNVTSAQVLVTSANLNRDDEIQRIKDTIETLLENGVVPIVNENDATSTAELEVGDNDQLSAYITNYIDADMLIILSDIDAYYDGDPRQDTNAKVLKYVHHIPKEELLRVPTPNNVFATGGIVTKLKAASYLMENGKSMFLASGFDLSDVKDFMLKGTHNGGTFFTTQKDR
ncbi:Glutamate 5-kinase [hydrothermal vent metagenome]|uniref:Glutamate 5-kinase n=1 Tax=hydrothermal vent metagenome TaxID=652676 RepID=A0A1W1D341_9ZZZZ